MAVVNLPVVKPEIIVDKTKYLFLYGSRRGGKSYTAAVKHLIHALEFPGARILITRKTMPSLKVTAMEIFKDVLKSIPGLAYKEILSLNIIEFGSGSKVYFIPMYLTGGGRNERLKSATFDWIWIEEATEFSATDVKEILVPMLSGTVGWRQMTLTFNPPARATHWIYDWYDVQAARGMAKRVHFSYLENPWLTDDFKAELESYKEIDEGLYRRQTLGEWRVDTTEALIYTNWDEKVLEGEPDEWIAGVDFGYNNPNAFVLIAIKDGEVYIVDEIYKSHILTAELGELIIKKLIEHSLIPNSVPIYADVEPDRIQELNNMGLLVYAADKKDVLAGIRFVKRFTLHINPVCENVKKEILTYQWRKDKDENLTEQPVKAFDHTMDAIRYALWTHMGTRAKPDFDVIGEW